MSYPLKKQPVSLSTNLKSLHKFPIQHPFTNQSANPGFSYENNFANYYQVDNANPEREDPAYTNLESRNDYWDSHPNQNFFRGANLAEQPESSQNYYFNEAEPVNKSGQSYLANEIFYEPSSINESRNYGQAEFEAPLNNNTNGLNSIGVSNVNETPKKTISKAQTSKRGQAKEAARELLQRFAISPQEISLNAMGRGGAARNRGSVLYQNLHSLMAGKNSTNAPKEIKAALSGPKAIKIEPKISQEMEQKPIEDPKIPSENSRASEPPKSNGASGVKVNALYYSLAKIEKNASTRSKIEQLAATVERKRNRRFWNAERDAQLISFIKVYGQDWQTISTQFNDPEMTPEVIQERYENRISPQINKGRFTLQEDQLIAHYYTTIGANWKKITAYLPGRTETMVRNRFYSSIKKRMSEDGFNQKLNGTMQDVSPHSSGNKLINQPSGGDLSSKDDLSEKYTGKFCEPEIKSGSTAASNSLKKKVLNAKKIESQATKKADRLSALLKAQASNMSSQQCEQKGNTVPSENFNPAQYSDQLSYNNEQFNASKQENLNEFNIEFQPQLQNNQNQRSISPIRNPFAASPILGAMRKNTEQEPWDPLSFDKEFDMNRREAHDIIGFDKMSLLNEKLEFQDDAFPNQNFNSLPQENLCEDFLNLKEDEGNGVAREDPLASMEEDTPQNTQKIKKPINYMEEELQKNEVSSLNSGLYQTTELMLQSALDQQGQNAKINSVPSAKLNQLESLMSQIRAIERLFNRTKQEINLLQGRFTAK